MKLILGIESSCDETSLALLVQDTTGSDPVNDDNNNLVASYNKSFVEYLNGFTVVSHITGSQASKFAAFGGVIPEISARGHAEVIFELYDLLLTQASVALSLPKKDVEVLISDIAVTTEPGLVSALKVGQEFAKIVAFWIGQTTSTPVIHNTHHLHGHIASAFYDVISKPNDNEIFPHLHLLVSGGNTQLLLMTSPNSFEIVGKTLDDAAGECLDKIGRMVGIDYPAGGIIGKIVGDRVDNPCNFSVGLTGKPGINFSYSGLKTAVRYYIRDHQSSGIKYEERLSTVDLKQLLNGALDTPRLKMILDIVVSAQTVIMSQLINQTRKAIKLYRPKSIGLSGGVSASKRLREDIQTLHKTVFVAPLELSGDNAVMIALAYLSKQYIVRNN